MPVLARRWLGGAGDSVRSENKESAQGPAGRSVPPLGVMPMVVTPGDGAGIAEKGTALTGASGPPAGPGWGLGLQATEQARSQAPTVHVPGGALPCWAASDVAEPGPGACQGASQGAGRPRPHHQPGGSRLGGQPRGHTFLVSPSTARSLSFHGGFSGIYLNPSGGAML